MSYIYQSFIETYGVHAQLHDNYEYIINNCYYLRLIDIYYVYLNNIYICIISDNSCNMCIFCYNIFECALIYCLILLHL